MDLITASHIGDLEAVKELLQAGADPNIVNRGGQTPLYWASYHGYLEIVRELLQAGADPNIAEKDGITPLMSAEKNRNFQLVKEFENHFPTLFHLSLRLLRKFGVDISSTHVLLNF